MKWHRKRSLGKRWNRNALINKNGNICGICGQPIPTMKDITIDHIIPKDLGGLDILDNFQLAHESCNKLKDNMSPEEFKQFQEVYA